MPQGGIVRAGRRVWITVHRWLGLALGAVLVVSGVTGAVLTFRQELDTALSPQLMTVTQRPGGEASFRPLDEIVAAALAAMPAGSRLGFGYYPFTDASAYQLSVQAPTGGTTAAGTPAFDGYEVFVDPYTATVTGTRLVRPAGAWFPRTLIAFADGLHLSLLIPGTLANGGRIVGWSTALLLVSLVTGVLLWWPVDGRWRRVFTLNRTTWTRLNHDLHQAAGIYALVVLATVLVSGTALYNLRAEFHWVVRWFSPTVDRYGVRSRPSDGRPAIALADAVRAASARTTEGRLDWLYPAPGPLSAYTVCRRLGGDGWFPGRRCVVVDKYTAEVLHVAGPVEGSRGDRFIHLQWFLHSGQVAGLPGRLLVLLSGLACPLIAGTGALRWWQKRRVNARASRLRRETRAFSVAQNLN